MALSAETQASPNLIDVKNSDDLYPRLSATDLSVKNPNETVRRVDDSVPRTTKDVSAVFKWKKGDKLYGKFANQMYKNYRNDINSAPDDNKYKDYYINTLKSVSKQLKEKNK